MTSPTEPSNADRLSTVTKVVGLWATFTLLFVGLQHVRIAAVGTAGTAIAGCIAIVVMLLITAWLLKMERSTFASVGIRLDASVPKHFIAGTALGLLVVAIMIGIVLLLTPVTIERSPDRNILAVLLKSFAILLPLALMEEVVFRAYPLFRFNQYLGTRAAVYATAVAFAFYHGLALGNLLGPGVWGLFYAWMALATKSIALPTGFHLGLNWQQAFLGMKPQYGDSIWVLNIGSEPSYFGAETVGLGLQLVLLVIGVVMVERLIAKRRAASTTC